MATDLEYIKGELNKLKNKKIDIPEVDLSTLEEAIRKIGMDVNAMQGSLQEFEDRVGKLESKSGGRF